MSTLLGRHGSARLTPAGVDPTKLPEPVRRALVERAVLECLLAGHRRIAIFGAGQHTRRLGLEPWASLEVVAILDQSPRSERLLGRPVCRPQELSEPVDAVVLSSDGCEHELAAAAGNEPALAGIPIVRIYDFPPPPPRPLRAVQLRRARVGSQEEVDRLLAADLSRLNFGCGAHPLPGWTNIDGGDGEWYDAPPHDNVFALDVFQALQALPDGCARYIASEHFVEHFSLDDGHRLLAEWFRVLQSGGVVRIVCPDAERSARLYLRDMRPAPEEVIERHQLRWLGDRYVLKPGERLTPAIVHNFSMWLDGHRFVYDFETLHQSLTLAGFEGITRCEYGGSEHETLRAIDHHDGGETGRTWIPSMALIVEATRPATAGNGRRQSGPWRRPNYPALYDDYWSRPDRWGSHSFADAEALVDRVLRLGGSGAGGRVLDVGCGMGQLVLTLRRRGIDARGLDVAARAIEEGNRQAPGCFEAGSILDIPHRDDSFDTVICTDVLEHLAEQDVPRALSELYRVTRRSVFATIATRIDRDGIWHLTVRDRAWWENRLFEAGFRKHPATQQVVAYEAIEREALQITLALQKIPPGVLGRYPLECLAAERGLHMDMLRESGRRSDAHIARYELARGCVGRGDVVLDVTCGLGYGSAVLCQDTERVIGVDNSRFAIEYARASYGPPLPTEFEHCDAADLGFLEDGTVDVVAAMETLEHLPRPQAFLAEVRRVLRPGGRVVVSVPNDWTDERGTDPNPHHLHVYRWASLKAEMGRHFELEAAFAQTAGGGMKLADRPRRLRPIDPAADGPDEEAEWWLAVGVKR